MENWRVERSQELPSAQEFASQVEPRNIPLVFEASIRSWPAFSKWNPSEGGLEYLKDVSSGEIVQAMLSTSGNNFYGDIRSHERVELTFGAYLDYTQHHYNKMIDQIGGGDHSNSKSLRLGRDCHSLERSRLYLAQVPMFSKDEETPPLRSLMQDIAMPSYLNSALVANVNLWMTAHESKSSTHYDPYHNILCVVVGQKKVTLWPPSSTPYLYPHPVYGEASNHSSVDFVNPDGRTHPLFKHAMESCQVVMLEAGDALFIPEGWYHQVDSKCFTIGVNLWWPSVVTLAVDSHMSGYYLRRIISSLLDSEKQKIIRKASSSEGLPGLDAGWVAFEYQSVVNLSADPKELIKGAERKQIEITRRVHAFEGLTAVQKQCLYSLAQTCNLDMKVDHSQSAGMDLVNAEKFPIHQQKPLSLNTDGKDTVVQVFSNLDALALRQVLLVMAHHFPRTLEVLVCKKLSPIAAEVLTRKFEEMDSAIPGSEQRDFYKAFYGAFEDQNVAMSALLDGKEAFAAQALDCLLDAYLGLSSGPSTHRNLAGGQSENDGKSLYDGLQV